MKQHDDDTHQDISNEESEDSAELTFSSDIEEDNFDNRQ